MDEWMERAAHEIWAKTRGLTQMQILEEIERHYRAALETEEYGGEPTDPEDEAVFESEPNSSPAPAPQKEER